MVLEKSGFLVTETSGDGFALLFSKHDAIEAFVQDMVVIERSEILGDDVEFSAQAAEGAAIDTVAVCCTKHLPPCVVNSAVNHESGGIEHPYWPTIYSSAFVVDEDQITLLDQRERYPERVHPKRGTVDRVT